LLIWLLKLISTLSLPNHGIKKLGNNPVSKYMKKREECKRYADMADTVHLGKIRYKNCMEDN
tara:strand:- start:908 stop:1093 length:186 start_codon:yes stop_codon:yes gene_type:complete